MPRLRELYEKHQRLINHQHQMTPSRHSSPARRTLSVALLFIALCFIGLTLSPISALQAIGALPGVTDQSSGAGEPASVAAFRQAVGGSIKPLIVELKGEPGVLRKVASDRAGKPMSMQQTVSYAQELIGKQDAFLNSLSQHGVRALLRKSDVTQLNGATRHIQYRFTYLLNGFVAYVAAEDVERLRALPEVAHVSEPAQMSYQLDRAIDYSLGTQQNPDARRTAVYGANKEFRPTDTGAHPETPRAKIDGFEGQNINIAVIDSGVDYRHPMFGGTGLLTPVPRVSGAPEDPADNKKVIYFYAFNEPAGDPTDDFGHGTLVASCAAGFGVDGNTPARLGFGTGRDGTGIGPTTNGSQLIGTAPQARIMAYKVCGPAPNCLGDIELSMEDAASPVTLVGQGDGGSIPTMVPKPIADVINLSLGDESGDPAGATSRAANNAALAGTIVVASAGNSGPGPGTIGAPSAATLAVSVAASLDPGSVAGADVLATNQIPLEPCDSDTRAPGCNNGSQVAGPPPEEGASSNANTPKPDAPQGIRVFPVAGGGALPVEENPGEPTENTGSVSAHYVFVDRDDPTTEIPASVTNRIALVRLTPGSTFTSNANPVAAANPSAILLITAVESATAVVVVGGIPTFTINPSDAGKLLDRLIDGEENGSPMPANGAVSRLPLRIADTISLAAFNGTMAGFSSRGPNDHPNAGFNVIKPDVTAPGVGVFGAATPEGLPDEAVGLASLSGYTTANGTSFSGPITAGAIALVRQRVREELNLDSTNLDAPNHRAKRFDSVMVARALLQNSATNLRSGFGVPEPSGSGTNSDASINEMGAGHINVAGALTANAIMVSPTDLVFDPDGLREFTPEGEDPSATKLEVMLPTASFGRVPVVNVNGIVTRTRKVVIRDVGPGGAGVGTYNLSVHDNRLPASGFKVSFLGADGKTPINSVSVPTAGGQASFFVQVEADGRQITIDPTEIMWYVTAASGSGQKMRMPFYFRAVAATIPNITAPVQLEPTGTEETAGSCAGDTNGNFTVRYNYTAPEGGPAPVGFRVQEGTRSDEKFFDPADEPLVAGANETFAGSEQWNSQINPETGSLAYFVPDTSDQNESLAMVDAVALPPGGATLSFVTTQDTEQDFDFAHVDISTDGVNYTNLASFSGAFTGTRFIDISAYAGKSIRVRFRMTSDLVVPGVGWFVENIRISSDDFRTIAEVGPGTKSVDVTGRTNGTYTYRVAGIFPNKVDSATTVTGPYSNLECVKVTGRPGTTPTPTPTVTPSPTATPTVTPSPTVTPTVTPSPTVTPTVTPTPTPSPTATASPSPAVLVNISTRLQVGRDDNVLIGGFIITGQDPKRVILRAIGPSLKNQSVDGRLRDPMLELFNRNGTSITSNDDWKESEDRAEIERSGLAPSNDRESVILRTLAPGSYTAIVRGKGNSTGIALVEAYDRNPKVDSTLANISTRGFVGTGDDAMIGGFIAGAAKGSTNVVVRALGPSLAERGVLGTMQDPSVALVDENGSTIRSNDNWKEAPNREAVASRGLAPRDDRESALFQTLPPGNYTAILRGKGNQPTGVALVEVYNVE